MKLIMRGFQYLKAKRKSIAKKSLAFGIYLAWFAFVLTAPAHVLIPVLAALAILAFVVVFIMLNFDGYKK